MQWRNINYSIYTLEKICKSLECSIDELFVSDDPQIQHLLAYAHKFNDLNYKDKSDTE